MPAYVTYSFGMAPRMSFSLACDHRVCRLAAAAAEAAAAAAAAAAVATAAAAATWARAHLGPGPTWPWAHLGPGPTWPRAHLGPGPLWPGSGMSFNWASCRERMSLNLAMQICVCHLSVVAFNLAHAVHLTFI